FPTRLAAALLELARLPGAPALLPHRDLEALAIDRLAALARDLLGELDREAVGVVEHEGVRTRDLRALPGDQLLQACEARLVGLDEGDLFLVEHPHHLLAPLGQLAVVASEELHGQPGHAREDRLLADREALLGARPRHRPAQEAPQHVTRALVAGQRPPAAPEPPGPP